MSNRRVVPAESRLRAKAGAHPEDLLVPWLARHCGRPVRWVETRSENMLAMVQGRAQVQDLTIGGRAVMGSGERVAVVQPHNFRHVLGDLANATDADVSAAIMRLSGSARSSVGNAVTRRMSSATTSIRTRAAGPVTGATTMPRST